MSAEVPGARHHIEDSLLSLNTLEAVSSDLEQREQATAENRLLIAATHARVAAQLAVAEATIEVGEMLARIHDRLGERS